MTIITDHNAVKDRCPIVVTDDMRVLNFATGICYIRDRLDLSRAAFAAKIGVSPRTVEGWEQGRTPSNSAVRLIASLSPPEEI